MAKIIPESLTKLLVQTVVNVITYLFIKYLHIHKLFIIYLYTKNVIKT